jgi:carbonic anhydrase
MQKLLQLMVCVLSVSALAAGDASSSPSRLRGSGTSETRAKNQPEAKPKAVEVKKVEKAEVKADVKPAEEQTSEFAGVLKELSDGNDRFSAGVERRRDVNAERALLTQGQHPRTIVLGCSDSRVPPEMLFDESLGDLFVVRNAGNVADNISLASIEYAAEHLHASVMVVLGHEKCGAVTAAASGEKMDSANLQALVDEIAPGLATLRARYKGAELVHLGVEANVTATANELIERSPLIRKLVEEGHLTILRAVYDLDSGHVRWLNLDEARACAQAHAGEALAEKH